MTSIRANRQHWNLISRRYQAEHDPQIGAAPRLWGMSAIPDARLHALGEVTGKHVLELGCGAGQWSRRRAELGTPAPGGPASRARPAPRRPPGIYRHQPLVRGLLRQRRRPGNHATPARLFRAGHHRRRRRSSQLPAYLRRLDQDPARRGPGHRRPHRAAARTRNAQRLHGNRPARLVTPLACRNALDRA